MENTGKADYLIKQSGCGRFQVLIILFVDVIMKIGTVCSIIFMAYGNYNPGWRCLDKNTTLTYNSFANSSGITNAVYVESNTTSDSDIPSFVYDDNNIMQNNNSSDYITEGSCDLFETCQNIEFNPETSTIVTEWGLLCDKSWIPSLMISIQMAGIFAGSLIAGQLGDSFGRKKLLYIAMALLCVLTTAAAFVTHWQVYAVIRFFIGGMLACLYNIYNILPAEYLGSKWRVRLASFPSWHIGGLLFGVAAMLCKDWRYLHIIIGVYCLIGCVPAIWVPESLRWLEVKNKTKQFQKVAHKMIQMNKLPITLESCDTFIGDDRKKHKDEKPTRTYTVLDLWRKGFRLYTIVIAFIWLSPTLAYYAISFSVKAMYGDFYVNLLLLFAADIPYSIVSMYIPNLVGRKKGSMLFNAIAAVCLLTATAIGIWAPAGIKNIGLVILPFMAKMNVLAALSCNMVHATEIYPTVVRSSAIGYCNFVARLGGILAPLLIPNDSQDLFVFYAIMGAMCLICCLLLTQLPETKNRTMKDMFDEDCSTDV